MNECIITLKVDVRLRIVFRLLFSFTHLDITRLRLYNFIFMGLNYNTWQPFSGLH